jgi:hypothetical protein
VATTQWSPTHRASLGRKTVRQRSHAGRRLKNLRTPLSTITRHSGVIVRNRTTLLVIVSSQVFRSKTHCRTIDFFQSCCDSTEACLPNTVYIRQLRMKKQSLGPRFAVLHSERMIP